MTLDQLANTISPDVASTTSLTDDIRRYKAEALKDRPGFAGCSCDNCIVIGHHLADWLTQEITTLLKDVGLDPFVPAEAWAAGEIGREQGMIGLEYVGVGHAMKAASTSSPWTIYVGPGNTTPFATLTEYFPWTADVELYSLLCAFVINPDLEPV